MNKILIADDEPWVAELLYELLKEEYEVVTADNGLTAWEYIKREKFDIVLLDIRMPRMSGLSILKKIKESGMNIISIIITAAGDVNTAVEVMKAGAYDYLIKDPKGNYLKVLPVTVENAIRRKKNEELVKKHTAKIVETNEKLQMEIISELVKSLNSHLQTQRKELKWHSNITN